MADDEWKPVGQAQDDSWHPIGEQAAPEGGREGGLLPLIKSIPGDIVALATPEGRAAWAQVPGAMLTGIKDWFEFPGLTAQGLTTPEEQIEWGLQTAAAETGGSIPIKGVPKAVAPVMHAFDDAVVAPAAVRLDNYVRTGDPNGVRLEPPQPDVKQEPVQTIVGSPVPDMPRSHAAQTGIPEVDSVLNSPVTQAVIDNPVVDRHYDVPYMAGGSTPLSDPTVYIDRHVPKEQTVGEVSFDPAEPWTVHENVEQHAMEILTKRSDETHWYQGVNPRRSTGNGMGQPQTSEYWTSDLAKAKTYAGPNGFVRVARESDLPPEALARRTGDVTTSLKLGEGGQPATIQQVKTIAELPSKAAEEEFTKLHQGMTNEEAYRVAHFEFAEKAEQAWYRAHGIDQEAAEAQQQKWLPRIQHENPENPPPNLYDKPYPHEHVAGAEHEAVAESRPSPDEVTRAMDIIRNTPELQQRSTAAFLQEARDLDVIGPEKRSLNEGTPAEVAHRNMAAARNQDIIKGKVEKTPNGEPLDSYQARFEKWVGKIETSADVQDFIRQAAYENNHFQHAREGEITDAHREQIADAAGIEPGSIDKAELRSKLRNDDHIAAAEQLMLQVTDNAVKAADEHRLARTEETRAKVTEAIIRRDAVLGYVLGLKAEWGRSGNALQRILRKGEENELNAVLKENGRDPKDIDAIADMIADMPRGDAARTLTKARELKRDGPLYWMWKQGLISGWLTHTKYLAANSLEQLIERGAVTPLAVIIGQAKRLGVDMDRVYASDALAGFGGLIGAIPDALKQSAEAFRKNTIPALKSERQLYEEAVERNKELIAAGEKPEKIPLPIQRAVEQTDIPRGPEAGVWARILPEPVVNTLAKLEGPLGVPGRSAGAIHTFFRNLGEGASLAEQAAHKAADEGLSPLKQEFWDRVAQHEENADATMLAKAAGEAWKGTFMQQLGPVGQAWASLVKKVPGLKWAFPFNHIPLNLISNTFEKTVLAPISKEWRDALMGRKGGIEQDKAYARIFIGSSVMAYFAHKFMIGEVTGAYPTDQKTQNQWKMEGKQPYSIKFGNYWVSYNKFGPAGNLAEYGATVGEAAQRYIEAGEHNASWDEALAQATGAAVLGAVHITSDEVGFMTLQNIFEAINDRSPTHDRLAQFVGSEISSGIPYSSAISQTASLRDPFMRKTKGLVDALKYRIPGLRETLPPKQDIFGPVPNPQYHSILRQREINTDPVRTELSSLLINPAPPRDVIGKVKLSPEQYQKYTATAAPLTHAALAAAINSAGWSNLPPTERRNRIMSIIHATRARAAATVQIAYPDLIRQGMQQAITGR